jgi:hypothetical protein
VDLASLDKATDYPALCEALWPDLPQRESEGHIWLPDPRDPGERADAFSINADSGMWCCHKTGDTGNMLTLVKDTGSDWATWRKVCPEAGQYLPGGKKKSGSVLARMAAAAPSSPGPIETKSKTFPEEMKKYEAMELEEWAQSFATAWGVPVDVVRAHGSCFCASRGRTAGKVVWNVAMRSPDGAIVGIKARALEPIWTSGGKSRKSNNRGSVGLVGWPRGLDDGDERPLLFVEGEKDFIVCQHELGERFIVVGNLGGAGTFKEDWAVAVRELGRPVYFLYDNDDNDAGSTGALKAARKCWSRDAQVSVVYLPVVGTDAFDFLRGKEGVCEAQSADALYDLIRCADAMADLKPVEVKATIQAHLDDEGLRKDDLSMSRALFQQILDHGGRFYHDTVTAYLLWHKKVYIIDRGDSAWNVLQGDLAGLSVHSPVGSRVCRGVRDLALQRGGRMAASAWQARRPGALYVPLYNEAADLLRITPEALDVVPNGTDDVVLLPDRDTKPIAFLPDEEYDHDRAERLWAAAFGRLNLEPAWQQFVSAFGRSFLFYNWCQTHPHLRFQGPAGSGKSTAFVFLNAIITGNPVPVGGLTHAGMWRLAARTPIVPLDDLEAKQLRREPYLVEFFLRAAVGGQRVMADSDDQLQTHRQTVGCHVISNGISPITGNNPALAERVIIVPMLPKEHHEVGFYAQGIVDDLIQNRDLMWNYLYREAQRILLHLEEGAIPHLMRQLPQEKRQRLHEFFALLSATLGHADKPAPWVDDWLESTSKAEDEAKAGGSSLVTLLLNLPAYLDAPDEQMSPGAKALRGVNTNTNGRLWEISETPHTLHQILLRMRKDTGIPYFPQTADELSNELRALSKNEETGITLDHTRRRFGKKVARVWKIGVDLELGTPIGRPKPPTVEETE